MIIVQPEHGRNAHTNANLDENNWLAFDHDSDFNSRRIFTMMAGPNIDKNLAVGNEVNPIGDATDVVPTIAEIFGIKQEVLNRGLLHPNAQSLFDRI